MVIDHSASISIHLLLISLIKFWILRLFLIMVIIENSTKSQFGGANWKEYSKFEFSWLDTILNKNILKREEMLSLLGNFDIEFYQERRRKKPSLQEMGMVLLADIPKKDLLPLMKGFLVQSRPNLLTFEEASEIYNELLKLNLRNLAELYVNITQNKKLGAMISEYIIEGHHPAEFSKNDILDFVLEELYKMPKRLAKKRLEAYLGKKLNFPRKR